MDYKLSDLSVWDEKIITLAKKHKLDWFDINYEVIDYHEMIGAMVHHGMPSMYSHWSFGKSFEQTMNRYNVGLEGLPYELIINSNPSLAYLMKENPLYLQILIMAHCIGHSDFFKNNKMFKNTKPNSVIQQLRVAKKRIQSYVENPNIGIEKVEKTIDACQALQFQTTKYGQARIPHKELYNEYVELINDDKEGRYRNFNLDMYPLEPDYDLLGFIEENAKIPDWQRDIIHVCRDEGQYFWPQIQTKTINEGWACVTGDTLIDTNNGLVTAKNLVEKTTGKVFDGFQYQDLVEWHHNFRTERIKITTNKGYTIHGSKNHRIWDGFGWKYLSEMCIGDILPIYKGNSTWSNEPQQITHSFKKLNNTQNNNIIFPKILCEKLSNIVGMTIGDGRFYQCSNDHLKSGFITNDDQLMDLFYNQMYDLFHIHLHAKNEGDECNKWRAGYGMETVVEWLVKTFNINDDINHNSLNSLIPEIIMISPKNVIASFLRGLFDINGYVDEKGNIGYTTTSKVLANQVHEILLKFGIISKLRYRQSKNLNFQNKYTILISGINSNLFFNEIGFNLKRKKIKLYNTIINKKRRKKINHNMIVVDIKHDIGEVYDFTVNNTHQYRSSAFMNHNSFWHYTLCHELELPCELHLPIIKMHNAVVRPHIGSINPYHLGFHLFQKIKERHGIDECFLAREVCYDVSFLRQYLTEEDCVELNLFSYSSKKKIGVTVDDISDTIGWKQVKEDLIANIAGGTIPVVYVDELKRDDLLIIRHEHTGRDLELKHANEVVEHIKYLWNGPIKFYTMIEEEPWEID